MRMIPFLTVALLLALVVPVQAQQKYAVVSIQKVLEKADAGVSARSELSKETEKAKGELEGKRKDIERLQEDLQKQGVAMSAKAKEDKENELRKKMREFQEATQKVQERMSAEEKRVLKPLLENMRSVVNDFAKRNGYALILDSSPPASPVIFYDGSVDVTDQITEALNKATRKSK